MNDWLAWLFFESPTALGVLLLLVCFVYLARWRRGGRPQPLLVALGVSAGLLLLQALVVTPRERAGAALTAIERDLRAGRVTALAETLAPGFAAGTMTGPEFLDFVRATLVDARITWITRTRIDIENAAGGAFDALVSYWADVVVREAAGSFRSRWRLTFEPDGHAWRIRAIEPVFMEGVSSPNWERLRRW